MSGPDSTYLSGNSSTMVDYILADVKATSCIESCKVLDTDQNTSDHLALSLAMYLPNLLLIGYELIGRRLENQEPFLSSNRLKPFTKRSRGNIEHIDKEISHVAWLITDAAQNTLPLVKPRKVNKFKAKHYHSFVQGARKHGEHGAVRAGQQVVPCTTPMHVEETGPATCRVLCCNGRETASVSARDTIPS